MSLVAMRHGAKSIFVVRKRRLVIEQIVLAAKHFYESASTFNEDHYHPLMYPLQHEVDDSPIQG